VESLADGLGIAVPREGQGGGQRVQDDAVQPLYQIQEEAARFYARQLREHPGAGRARDYLKGRGVSGEVAGRFLLGYAPPGWRSLPDSLPASLLLGAGLAVYDRFRDRVMFPIRDRRGRVIGFGGRVLNDEKPKYLNSPETATFKKSKEVYGLHELLASRQKPARIVVVEGYMDVIALAQHGIQYAVATLGTATSADHAALLFRYTPELVFCFDGDQAGRNAAWKALEASLPTLREGRSIRFLMLPDSHDPDSLVREEGPERFEARLAQAQPLSDYFFKHLAEPLDLESIEGRAALVKKAGPLLGLLPEGVYRDMMQGKLKAMAGQAALPASPRPARPGPYKPARAAGREAPSSILRVLLASLIQEPSLFSSVDPEARRSLEREEKAGGLARKLFAVLDEKPGITLGGIRERFRDEPEQAMVEKLSVSLNPLSGDSARQEFPDALRQYMAQSWRRQFEQLSNKGLSRLTPEERGELRNLQEKLLKLPVKVNGT
jgi:DNA primase